ncbi:beta-alanyl-dopamine/carcinine hydrolase isoform X1 [Diorhabda sublineata]|uniref:beta-alanyl-dopamine/carcinine hydrolase isoform X1 n=1 Tax=Diorhabda sublineata TaxID=1163346 RepID=UPI0024E1001B|nr:beta-alanyl-dopamine/carcinine hydrolase isoform X1 [Diorhabda sublineata]
MASSNNLTKNIRRQNIPILYTKGTYYEVGFNVGRTFSGIIHSFLNGNPSLEEDFLPAYNTLEGKRAYEETLNSVKKNFPQYIRELEGIADGANVPFYKLFLLHMDDIMLLAVKKETKNEHPTGCSSICVNNKGHEVLGHTEDALGEVLNHIYFVSAHIIPDKIEGKCPFKEEKFTSLCYAGHLPGYTMSYNHHGLIFTINTLSVKHTYPGKTPRMFITRSLLGAENFVQAQEIIRDRGCGAGNGCSINMTFLNQEGDRMFHNAEMAPSDKQESQLNVFTASPGECIIHTNKYLRIKIDETNENMTNSSLNRMATFATYPSPKQKHDVLKMLSDTTNPNFPVFLDTPNNYVKTVAVGIFDCVAKTWSLYSDNPSKNEPLVVLPLVLKNN